MWWLLKSELCESSSKFSFYVKQNTVNNDKLHFLGQVFQNFSKSVLPVDLSIFVKVLKTLKDFFQHSSYTGFIQYTVLVFPFWNDVLNNIQHRACNKDNMGSCK